MYASICAVCVDESEALFAVYHPSTSPLVRWMNARMRPAVTLYLSSLVARPGMAIAPQQLSFLAPGSPAAVTSPSPHVRPPLVCVQLRPFAQWRVSSQPSLAQSACTAQFLPVAHFRALVTMPPQSTSVSSAFFTPSLEVGVAHVLVAGSQTPLVQSTAALQPFASAQRGAPPVPPQSTSLSSPFWTPSSALLG